MAWLRLASGVSKNGVIVVIEQAKWMDPDPVPFDRFFQ